MGDGIPRGSLSLTKTKVLFSTLRFPHIFAQIKWIMHTDCLLSVGMLWCSCCNKQGSEDFSVNAFPVYVGFINTNGYLNPNTLSPSPKKYRNITYMEMLRYVTSCCFSASFHQQSTWNGKVYIPAGSIVRCFAFLICIENGFTRCLS